MKLLVTGGLGFIGSHFVDRCLSIGDEVTILDCATYASNKHLIDEYRRKNVKILISNICNYEDNIVALAQFKPDCVVNFAAETHVDNSIANSDVFVTTNVLGTAALLNACRQFNVKLCHISTDEVYGPALSTPFIEIDKLSPMNPYSATKASAELLIQSYQNTYDFKAMIIRPSNNYGPRQNIEKFIPKLVNSIILGENFPLYGDGMHVREWTFVHDTAKHIRSLIDVEGSWNLNSIYNLSSEQDSKNVEVIAAILDIINSKLDRNIAINDIIEFVKDRAGHDRRYSISSKKISKLIDLQFTPFMEGLNTTLESML